MAPSVAESSWADITEADSDIAEIDEEIASIQLAGNERRGERFPQQEGWKRRVRWGTDRRRASKMQCQFIVNIDADSTYFPVKTKLLGPQGKHMKDIWKETGAKLRLRGRGSGYLEEDQQESADPLMLCVSASGKDRMEKATQRVTALMRQTYEDFDKFCKCAGFAAPGLNVEINRGPRLGAW